MSVHEKHKKTTLQVFRLCEKCNKEFEIIKTENPNHCGTAKSKCPHCGFWNNIWIRAKLTVELV
jgi:hydrogenase maturation factor HypF (carbamoyltransferase family)